MRNQLPVGGILLPGGRGGGGGGGAGVKLLQPPVPYSTITSCRVELKIPVPGIS